MNKGTLQPLILINKIIFKKNQPDRINLTTYCGFLVELRTSTNHVLLIIFSNDPVLINGSFNNINRLKRSSLLYYCATCSTTRGRQRAAMGLRRSGHHVSHGGQNRLTVSCTWLLDYTLSHRTYCRPCDAHLLKQIIPLGASSLAVFLISFQ